VAQVESERHDLKPGLIFEGKGLKPATFQAVGQLISTCTAPNLRRCFWFELEKFSHEPRAPPFCSGACYKISKMQIVKAVSRLIGSRAETTWVPGAFKAMGHN
jgi:hypothetical protein